MTLIHMLMEVDGDEQKPLGAFGTVEEARAAALANDLQYADDSDELRAEVTSNFNESWNAVVGPGVESLMQPVDIQWESGGISLDYRIFSVEMR